jgi:hypothetical protein
MKMNKKTVFAILLAALVAGASSGQSPAKPKPKPKAAPAAWVFDSSGQAVDGLIDAISRDDVAALNAIFGPLGKKIVSSGDSVSDKNDRAQFVELARNQKRTVPVKGDPHRFTLVVGPDDWPFPVPLIESGGKWRFDAAKGLHEVQMRRIGRNELNAIAVCRGYVEAQHEYASQARDETGFHMYAQKIVSTPGKRDGLAWLDASGKPAGPVGENAAKALEQGYSSGVPFHGYYFAVLKSQGPAAPHGRLDYIVQGKMLFGFALLAWPAKYRESGVKTFIVSHDGIVYEKDLGAKTPELAKAIRAYNPDKSWSKVTGVED